MLNRKVFVSIQKYKTFLWLLYEVLKKNLGHPENDYSRHLVSILKVDSFPKKIPYKSINDKYQL